MTKTKTQFALTKEDAKQVEEIYNGSKDFIKKAVVLGYKINEIKKQNLNKKEVWNKIIFFLKQDSISILIMGLIITWYISTKRKK